jgi:hypothetical protein
VVLLLLLWLQVVSPSARLAVGCAVVGDPDARVYELRRERDGRWLLMMVSRKTGTTPVVLPLPDARPVITGSEMTLSYETLNGGRDVEWSVTPSGATLNVHANFELEVNIEADLDPRVELMNTDGTLSKLSCEIAPQP